jgi:hypothetical protein
MPIIEQTISAAILVFLNKNTVEKDVEKAKQAFADDLSKIIANAIKSATVTIPTGAVIVTTTGSPTTQQGSNTAPALGTLS